MKRIASGPLNRYDYPVTVPNTEETRSDAPVDPTQQPASLTIEQLRSLPLPPFPPGFQFVSHAPEDESFLMLLAKFSREGFDCEDYDYDIYFWILSFCMAHGYTDALFWFLLRMSCGTLRVECSGFKPSQIPYLFACLNRLPEPVTLMIAHESPCSGACCNTVIEELPKSNGIKEIYLLYHRYSKPELERWLAAIKDHPVIYRLQIAIDATNADTLNHYLRHDSTPRELILFHCEPPDIFPNAEMISGLMDNRTLTKLTLEWWFITPTLSHALASPGNALTELTFDNCKLTPEAIAALANALPDNDTLSHLTFFFCSYFSAAEMKPLYDALRLNRSIVSLYLPLRDDYDLHIHAIWEVLQVNLTICSLPHMRFSDPGYETADFRKSPLLPQIRQRLRENKDLLSYTDQYPMAKQALSILPGNLPNLPPDISAYITRLLLQTDATALPAYRTLHMLALHKQIKEQDKPRFPDHVLLTSCLPAQLLAQGGTQALPLPPDVMRSIVMFCIRHKAADALDWLVVHASRGTLDLRGKAFATGESGWLIQWTRAAPCHIKLRLDNVPLSGQDIADIAEHLKGNPALTSLSLQGCAMRSGDVHLICEALNANLVMVELLLSENLISLNWSESGRAAWKTSNESRCYVESNGHCVSFLERVSALGLEEKVSAIGMEELTRFPDLLEQRREYDVPLETPSSRSLSLATIAFFLRRNVRLQKGVVTSDDFMPDKAFMHAIDASSRLG